MKVRSVLLAGALAAVAAAAAAAPAGAVNYDRGPDWVMPGKYDGTICFNFGPGARDAQGNVYRSYCDAWQAGAHVAWRLI